MPGIRSYRPQVDISSHTPGGATISAVVVKAEFVKISISAKEQSDDATRSVGVKCGGVRIHSTFMRSSPDHVVLYRFTHHIYHTHYTDRYSLLFSQNLD